ncbi:MAG: FGGY-family carbohydrate kinase [Nocardioidaceae bacterium]|nr:FGGY-family carbohydrate kinase [Nocardioidaceae bacterium]
MSGNEAAVVVEVGDELSLQRQDGSVLVLGPGLSTVRWFRETFCATWAGADDAPFAQLDAAAASVADGSTGVLFVPTEGGGTFFGMTYQTRLAECARAVFEGLIHAAVTVMDDHGVRPASIRLVTRDASGALWRELLAKAVGVAVASEDGTDQPTARGIASHAALHALYRQCIDTIEGRAVRP